MPVRQSGKAYAVQSLSRDYAGVVSGGRDTGNSMIGDTGTASCVDAKAGQQVWQEWIGGEYSASPVSADGKLWFCSEDGKTTVLKPRRTFEKLAENRLDDGFLASPAIAGKAFYLRTRTHVYRIEEN